MAATAMTTHKETTMQTNGFGQAFIHIPNTGSSYGYVNVVNGQPVL